MNRSYIEKTWDLHYWIYDFTWAILQRASYKEIARQTHSWSNLNILEVGCGKAAYLEWYNKQNNFYLIDASPKMIQAAQKNIKKKQMHHIKMAECQSIYKTSFEDHFFDVIICSHVLTVVDDVPRALAEIKRVLKPNGRLIVANHVPKNHLAKNSVINKITKFLGWSSARDTTKLLASGGFSKIASTGARYSEVVSFLNSDSI